MQINLNSTGYQLYMEDKLEDTSMSIIIFLVISRQASRECD